jgi:hypothetical protein
MRQVADGLLVEAIEAMCDLWIEHRRRHGHT